MPPFEALRRPIDIGSVTLRNRFMMTAHGPGLSHTRYLRYLEERARNGVALFAFNLGRFGIANMSLGPNRPYVAYGADADTVPPHPLTVEGSTYYDSLIPEYREWVTMVHSHGAKCFGQLYHPGAAEHMLTFQPVVGPSATGDEYESHNPHPLSAAEIDDVVQTYVNTARRAIEAGFDGIEIHAAHGYLLHQFLSPLWNTRTDEYGGSLANRARLLLHVLATVRAAVDDEVPVGIRLAGPDPVRSGLALDELLQVASLLDDAGMAYVSISCGTFSGLHGGGNLAYIAPGYVPPAPGLEVAAAMKRTVAVPVAVTGRMVDVHTGSAAVEGGHADIVGMVRALIADAALVTKSLAGRADDVIPCIGCNECRAMAPLTCPVNPSSGREAEMEVKAASVPKRIVLVGGGPAGLECARYASQRGHDVTIVDARPRLGGMIDLIADHSEQSQFRSYLDSITRRLAALGVTFRLGVMATPDFVRALEPDVVAVATGARYDNSSVTIGPNSHVMTADAVFADLDALGARVVIDGGTDGHLPPVTVADVIARTGRRVTVLSARMAAGQDVESASYYVLMRRLLSRHVQFHPLSRAVGIDGTDLVVHNIVTNDEWMLDGVDTLVLAGARVPRLPWSDADMASLGEVRLIGDCLAPRRMVHATLEGARLGALV